MKKGRKILEERGNYSTTLVIPCNPLHANLCIHIIQRIYEAQDETSVYVLYHIVTSRVVVIFASKNITSSRFV